MKHARLLAPVVVGALLLGCDDQTLNPPTATAGDLFVRYMALGNSITAGIQSGGIDSVTQSESYAALLAGRMGTTFVIPWLNPPGCPAPFTNIFTQTRVGGTGATDCAFRTADIPEFINNVAQPGADILEVLTNDTVPLAAATDVFKTFLLGGRTPLQWAEIVRPTFVTVWVGNNDALGTVLDTISTGDPSLVTPPTAFATRYAAMMDSLDALGSVQGGVLMGVVQVALAPYVSQGRVWFGLEPLFDAGTQSSYDSVFVSVVDSLVQDGILPALPVVQNATLTSLGISANFFDVALNCLDSLALGNGDFARASVPFHLGGPVLSAAFAGAEDPVAGGELITFGVDSLVRILNPAAPAPDPSLLPTPIVLDCSVPTALTADEVASLFGAVSAYNAAIEAEADARQEYIFLDPNDLLGQLAQDTSAIRPFPAFPGTASPDATLNTPFGSALSLDGIHPSASTHRLVAGALITAINQAFGTSIPALQ